MMYFLWSFSADSRRPVISFWWQLLVLWVAQSDVCSTGDQEVAGSTPAGSASFFRGD